MSTSWVSPALPVSPSDYNSTWDSSLSYQRGKIVWYSGTVYICGNDVASGGSSPAVDTTNWMALPPFGSGGGSAWPGLALTPPVLSNFSWVNQGGAAADGTDNQIAMYAPATSGESWRILETALPVSTPWTLVAGIVCGPTFADNYNGVGIGVKDSGNNKMVIFKAEVSDSGANPADAMAVTEYSNATSGVSNHKEVSVRFGANGVLWLKITNDGTNFKFYYSPALGKQWLLFDTMAVTAYLTAPATAFFTVNASSNYDNAASLVSWTLG